MERLRRGLVGWMVLGLLLGSCAEEAAPVNRVGVNVVDKALFEGSWYYTRTVIDVDYEAAGFGTYPGDAAMDFAGSDLASVPRIRWVIDEDYLYAFRDYELIEGGDGEPRTPGTELGHPVAAFRIEKHFDIRRSYNPNTGEEYNVVVENDMDRRWYERRFMRVDWSSNVIPGYYGQIANLYEIFGFYNREPAQIFVQAQSEFPDSWRPQFHFMGCDGADDESESCGDFDRLWASDYDKGDLYHMSFVSQELLSPGLVPDPFGRGMVQWCVSVYSDAPLCSTVSVFVRNAFLKVSDQREYVPENWVDTRFDRFGYFRLERSTLDRRTEAGDALRGYTDFLNYNVNRHNIWMDWVDDDGNPIPYSEREVRQVHWFTTTEMPAHLVKPAFQVVAEWNRVFMETVRTLQGKEPAVYPRVQCQSEDPDGYCFCKTDEDGNSLLPDTDGDGQGDCPGRYDPFVKPEDSGATNPYQCWIEVPDGAEPDWNDPNMASRARDEDFYGWYAAKMVGPECVHVLHVNPCNRATIAENGGTKDGMECAERGDARFKFVSYVDQPGTAFLGVATLRGDPVTGEVLFGDANIGGPALDGYRTYALQWYDLLNGNLSELEVLTGENVRNYLANLDNVQLPHRVRLDFNVGLAAGATELTAPMRQEVDRRMARYFERAQQLREDNPNFRRLFEMRRQRLVGSPTERRLLDNLETLVLAGIERLPAGYSAKDLSEDVLDKISPLRVPIDQMMANYQEFETKVSKANVMLPNELTDWSVLEFVRRHTDWPRARLEFGINRLLYFETQLHELGHCLGLRHDFGASADIGNYFDEYYHINRLIPLPDPRDYDMDGTPGLSPDEQEAYEDAYAEAKKKRELAGIDQWQNSSIMEYTAQWYERTVQRAGRYDEAVIAFGYGDLIQVYDNEAGRDASEIDPTNTPRRWFKFYNGGEPCTVGDDSTCPFSDSGSRAAELLPTNRDAGLTQRCVANPNADGPAGPLPDGICTNFYDDLAALGESSSSPRWVPVEYRFCTDDRVGTLGWCHRFDEGDSYREIVRNVWEQYERQYIFTNFRRYRRTFSIGGYLVNRLVGRQWTILQDIFQNLLYEYASNPEYRTQVGPFGFYDQFMASADIMNFYARVLGSPAIGSYVWNDAWQRYERQSSEPNQPSSQLSIDLGLGRYFSSRYQDGLTGIFRIERIGSFYERWFAMMMLTQRGWKTAYSRDVPFFTNFYDLFPVEMQQIFQGIIQERPEAYMPRVECGGGTFPNCTDPRIVYLDFYRGDCSNSATCRPDPEERYQGLPVIEGGGSVLLQYLGALFSLSEFPVFFDTTFQNQLFICVRGQGDCHLPSDDAVEGVDYAQYTSSRYGQTFLAWQVDPTVSVPNAKSIGFEMVKEASDTAYILQVLRRWRGDFGAPTPPSATERDHLANDLGYDLPAVEGLSSEIDRLDGRLRSLESFFYQLIQLERDLGIAGYIRY